VTEPILRTVGLGKRFGGFVALKDVSVDFEEGQITSIIGPNGAGKTTFLNLISGGNRPSAGRILFRGTDVTGLSRHRYAHLGIARSFQITSIFPALTAIENVRFSVQAAEGRSYDFWTPRERLRTYHHRGHEPLRLVGLDEKATSRADALAHGEQRALDIAIALACSPRLLLLDEPTAGMSPEETKVVMQLIVKLAERHTVVLVEHKMKLIMGISQHIIVLHHGELMAQGSPAEIRDNCDVRRVYLGKSRYEARPS
jgi:branched-chain amino acid transport system ATP-binding protein